MSAPPAPSAPRSPEAPGAPGASGPPSAAAAPSAPSAPKAAEDDAKKEQRLSGKHWQKITNDKWPESDKVEDLSDEFRPKAQAFIAMLAANKINVEVSSTKRPAERAYLYHYCLEVAAGRTKPADVPKLATVDIEWDHDDEEKSKSAAKEMADAFGLVGVAAYPSNHSGGNAIDMKMNFSANTKDGKNTITYKVQPTDKDSVSRDLKVDDEAIIGVPAKGKAISDIADRELSKAGKDFGAIRAIKNDIVHWSLNGG
ncbi:MAG: hypothetical protein HY735_10425 [Verrucomicrobia bacterium]|nr:hypothetical protein [Verrucomicrobiota bacterium]MBI4659245.1 hypothetical protein [Verrucomicrobiota bacterium]